MVIIHKLTLLLTKDLITDGFCIILFLLGLCKFPRSAPPPLGPRGLSGVRGARALPRIDIPRGLLAGGDAAVLLVLAAGFLAGSAAGALAGSAAFDLVPQLLAEDGSVYGGGSYAALLLDCSAAHLLTLLFSTSVFGVLLIPAAMAMRGFTLACSAAWLAAAWPGDGWALALAVLALPALFTVPSLFVTAQSGMAFSLRLLGAYTRPAPPMPRRRGDGRAAAVALMLLAAAGVEYFIVPTLVRLILK